MKIIIKQIKSQLIIVGKIKNKQFPQFLRIRLIQLNLHQKLKIKQSKTFQKPDYRKRIGHLDINEIKQHNFFNEVDWNRILQMDGLIVPKIVLKEGENDSKNNEKVEQFLNNLEKKEVKNKTLACKLKSQLSNLERLDLLVKLSLEEANDKLSKIYNNEYKLKRILNKIDHYEQEHQTQMFILYQHVF